MIQEPPQDTPIPPALVPTSVPAAVPPPGLSSQESASTGPRLTGRVVLSGARELFTQRGMVLQPVVEEVSVDVFYGANRPQWPWDEGKIAFDAFPEGRLAGA